MDSRKKQLFLVVVFGAFVAVCAYLYMDARIDQYRPKKEIQVAIAKRSLKAGAPLNAKDIEFRSVPQNFLPRNAIKKSEQDQYNGQEIRFDVQQGDYVLKDYFTELKMVGNKLSELVDAKDYRAVTLPVDQTSSLAASIVAGDSIDIVFTFNVPQAQKKMSVVLFQKVPVIATGSYSVVDQEIGARGGKSKKYTTLTLKMLVQEAFRLNYARQMGKIDVLLRNSTDLSTVSLKPVGSVTDLLAGDDKATVENMVVTSPLGGAPKIDREEMTNQLKQLMKTGQIPGK